MRTIAVVVVCLVFSAANAFAQAFAGVNIIAARSSQGETHSLISLPMTPGNSPASIAQSTPALGSAKSFDIDGGFTITHGFGGAVRWGHTEHDYPTAVGFALSNPFVAPSEALAGKATDAFDRNESALDFMATYSFDIAYNTPVRVFGGPTYFLVEQAALESVSYDEAFAPHSVDITGLSTRNVDLSAWGYNVGADVSYFFTRHVGIGGGVRLNRGTATNVEFPLPGLTGGPLPILFPSGSTPPTDFHVGHATLAVGVRLRY
jgi:hypothetical protein